MTAPGSPAVDTRSVSESPIRQLLSTDPCDAVPRLTLLLLLPHEPSAWLVVVVAATAVAMVTPRLYRSPALWLAIAAWRGISQATDWHGLDDHVILITYLCAALGLAFATPDPVASIRTAGRLLIGLVMVFATTWKLSSGEFVDRRFFEHTLLADPRFEPVARWIGGLDRAAIEANRAAVDRMSAWELPGAPVELVTTDRLGWVALALTVGAIAIEGWLAIAWLGPDRVFARFRVPSLVAFCALTYLIVPVVLFGLTLLALAYAPAPAGRPRHTLVGAMVGLLVLAPVWTRITGVAL